MYGSIGVTYRNDYKAPRSMADAVDMFKLFGEIVPATIMRNACATVRPEKFMPQKEIARGYKRDPYAADYAVLLDVSHISESHTSAKIEFFAIVGGKPFEISVEFGTGYIGKAPQLAPRAQVTRGYGERIQSRTYIPDTKISAYADKYLSFASGDMGPIKNSAHHVYMFLAENGDENAPAVACEHAIEMLLTIARETGA